MEEKTITSVKWTILYTAGQIWVQVLYIRAVLLIKYTPYVNTFNFRLKVNIKKKTWQASKSQNLEEKHWLVFSYFVKITP